MEKEKNIMIMVIQHLKVNIKMIKEMEKEQNIIIQENQNLKDNILKEINGMVKDMTYMKMLNINKIMEREKLKNIMIMAN